MNYMSVRVTGIHWLVMVAIMVSAKVRVLGLKVRITGLNWIGAIDILLANMMVRMLKHSHIGERMAGTKKLTDGNYHKWRKQRERVLQRDQYSCFYCQAEANTVDHLIARVKGGDDSLDNLVACCNRCNVRKGSRAMGVFLGRSDTPPVSPGNLHTKTVSTVLKGPFSGQSQSEQTG